MKYILKQKLLSFGDDFDVLDESGNKVFYFDSKIGGFRPKIIIQDGVGRQLGVIRKKMFSFRPTYIIRQESRELGRIIKKAFSFRKSFIVQGSESESFNVVGSFIEHSYYFYKNRQQIAEVSKRWFTGKDTYGVDISGSNNALLILSAAVIIDILCHPKRDSSF